MNIDWNDSEPIYLQLKGAPDYAPAEWGSRARGSHPSVRQVAAEYQLNPLTVGRTIQELADEG